MSLLSFLKRGVKARRKSQIVLVHDMLATTLALFLSLYLRFSGADLAQRASVLGWLFPLFLSLSVPVYHYFSLHRIKWRFASLPDLFNIFLYSTALAVIMYIIDHTLMARHWVSIFTFGEKTIFLYWILQMFCIGGPRIFYRYLRHMQAQKVNDAGKAQSILIVGQTTDVELVLRALEHDRRHQFIARGILSPYRKEVGAFIRRVPVVGNYEDLEQILGEWRENQKPITQLIFSPSAYDTGEAMEKLLTTARRTGLILTRLHRFEAQSTRQPFKPIEIEDLLFRPPVAIDLEVEIQQKNLSTFFQDKKIIVTGGGGSIGSELCSQLVQLNAKQILILDHSEPALYHIFETLSPLQRSTHIEIALADVRDFDRLSQIFKKFQPDYVIHAAALKHVPFLEQDWAEGIKTNIFGTLHVGQLAQETKSSFVFISTDKAVEPVSILGATKRLAEMYTQSLDAEVLKETHSLLQRFISVRFGNVLGSVGSVVPKFKEQIARGGPVTVTHPDMVRYFMTSREAVALVLRAIQHATSFSVSPSTPLSRIASLYVLKMGQPARIIDLAKRMIRLAGYEPEEEIALEFTGIRPGERLHEVLLASNESVVDIGLTGVMGARGPVLSLEQVQEWVKHLHLAVSQNDRNAAESVLAQAAPSVTLMERIGEERRASSEIAQNAKSQSDSQEQIS